MREQLGRQESSLFVLGHLQNFRNFSWPLPHVVKKWSGLSSGSSVSPSPIRIQPQTPGKSAIKTLSLNGKRSSSQDKRQSRLIKLLAEMIDISPKSQESPEQSPCSHFLKSPQRSFSIVVPYHQIINP